MECASIYRKFRPDVFDNVIGQNHIVRTLTNQIKSGEIGHAYLFTGTRGTGKTSCAKIFARAVNCLNPRNGSPCGECATCKALAESDGIDVIEIDAASNNGVDEIRTLKENVLYRPTIGKYKVYIIDEVHMLSGAAFNALLKTLEEPPEHIVFILATTEVQKLPQTILSRCMRFDFRLLSVDELVGLLKNIFDKLEITYDERALIRMAIQGEGSARDTLSIADMCRSYCGNHISYEDTLEILCATDFATLNRLGTAILEGNTGDALTVTDELLRNGRTTVAKDLANYFNDLISVKNVKGYKIRSITETEYGTLTALAEKYGNYRIARVMDMMAGVEAQLRFASQPRILLEATIVRACELTTEVNTDGLAGRVKELESELRRIKTSGIKVSDVSVAAASATDSPVPQPTREDAPKVSVASLLRELGAKEEEKPVFVETEKKSDNSGIAMEIWSRVQERLHENNEVTLYLVCDGVEKGLDIDGSDYILKTSDKATYEILSRDNSKTTLTELICEVSGKKYTFSCRLDEGDKGLSPETGARLNDLFSGQIKFKK